VNSPEDGPVGPKHVEIRRYMNKIEIVTSVGSSFHMLLVNIFPISFSSSYIKLTQVLIINYGIIIKSVSILKYMVWHVDKYKITFKLVISHWTNEMSFSKHSRILFSSEYFHYKIFIHEKCLEN
jgi:hypothetical protein